MISNVLKYYYNLESFSFKEKEENYIIHSYDNMYIFHRVYISSEELSELHKLNQELLKYDSNINELVVNKMGDVYTVFNNNQFVLIKIGKNALKPNLMLQFNPKLYGRLYRTNWAKLWSMKIDYLEFQREHIKGEYPMLDKYFDFFVGLTENAIFLFSDSLYDKDKLKIAVQHKRYNDFFYDNPLNLVIDYRVRDIAGAVKYKYFHDEFDIDAFNTFLEKANFSKEEIKVLFSRLLFPSFYFDLYDNIVNNRNKEEDVYKYIDKFDNYLLFLKKVGKLKWFHSIVDTIKWLK